MSKERAESNTAYDSPWPLDAWPDVPTRFVLCTRGPVLPARLHAPCRRRAPGHRRRRDRRRSLRRAQPPETKTLPPPSRLLEATPAGPSRAHNPATTSSTVGVGRRGCPSCAPHRTRRRRSSGWRRCANRPAATCTSSSPNATTGCRVTRRRGARPSPGPGRPSSGPAGRRWPARGRVSAADGPVGSRRGPPGEALPALRRRVGSHRAAAQPGAGGHSCWPTRSAGPDAAAFR